MKKNFTRISGAFKAWSVSHDQIVLPNSAREIRRPLFWWGQTWSWLRAFRGQRGTWMPSTGFSWVAASTWPQLPAFGLGSQVSWHPQRQVTIAFFVFSDYDILINGGFLAFQQVSHPSKYVSGLKQNDIHEKKPFSGSVFSCPLHQFWIDANVGVKAHLK